MKLAISLALAVLSLSAIEAKADYQCTFTCGSKEHQEPKVGYGRSQYEAMRNAQAQTCTQYVGGQPQFFRGCVEIDNGRGNGGWHRPRPPHHNPGWGRPEQWQCTYRCGSKPGQEPKVGFGRSQVEAARNAQAQTCTQYVGGNPTFFEGCQRL